MNKQGIVVVALLAGIGLAGCDQGSQAPASAAVDPSVQQSSVAMDAPIPSGDVDLAFRLVDELRYSASTDTAEVHVEVTNNGNATVASSGPFPVNLGVVIQAQDGTMGSPPADLDFVRVPLPHALAPGQSATVAVAFPVAPTFDGKVVLDGVQEQVSWFNAYGKPVLDLGSYMRCDAAEGTLCRTDGTVIATANR